MKRAFTIVELLVAMGLFGILLAASGIIFAIAVNAHRTAEATTEITRNLAAITDQLNADFRGLRKDCPIAIWFEVDPCDPCNPDVRHDQILFFANGDFQSYGHNGTPFTGNTARVYYGQANIIDYPNRTVAAGDEYFESNILSRRQHIYHPPDPCLPAFPVITDITSFRTSFTPQYNDEYEHDNISLSQWKVITNDPCYNNQIIQTCFSNTSPEGRPAIDLDNAKTLHMFMARGVGHFQIQWSYFTPENKLQWWPSTDPDGNPNTDDSHFPPEDMFGIYFNMPGGVIVDADGDGDNDWGTFPGFFPVALKFTFTLYDSKKIFKQGKTFTHIVYLDD